MIYYRTGIAFLLSCVMFVAHAVILDVKDTNIIVSGNIGAGDFQKFANLFTADRQLNTVIFQDCYGGLVNEGAWIAALIEKKRMATIAKGQVQSSCAYAFMAGKVRRFDSGWGSNLIMFHAARNENPENDVRKVNDALLPYLVIQSGRRLKADLVDLIRQSNLERQGVIFFSEKWIFGRVERVFYCNGSEKELDKCRIISGSSALTSGIVTQ